MDGLSGLRHIRRTPVDARSHDETVVKPWRVLPAPAQQRPLVCPSSFSSFGARSLLLDAVLGPRPLDALDAVQDAQASHFQRYLRAVVRRALCHGNAVQTDAARHSRRAAVCGQCLSGHHRMLHKPLHQLRVRASNNRQRPPYLTPPPTVPRSPQRTRADGSSESAQSEEREAHRRNRKL